MENFRTTSRHREQIRLQKQLPDTSLVYICTKAQFKRMVKSSVGSLTLSGANSNCKKLEWTIISNSKRKKKTIDLMHATPCLLRAAHAQSMGYLGGEKRLTWEIFVRIHCTFLKARKSNWSRSSFEFSVEASSSAQLCFLCRFLVRQQELRLLVGSLSPHVSESSGHRNEMCSKKSTRVIR